MGVPVVASTPCKITGSGIYLNNGNPRLGQSAREQHTLAADMITVHDADSWVFVFEVVSFFDRRTQ